MPTTFKYPLEVINGSLILQSDPERLVVEAIKGILNTREEERVLNPDFGTQWLEFQSLQDLPNLLRSLEASLAVNLAEYPGITYRLVGSITDLGIVEVIIFYEYQESSGEFTVRL